MTEPLFQPYLVQMLLALIAALLGRREYREWKDRPQVNGNNTRSARQMDKIAEASSKTADQLERLILAAQHQLTATTALSSTLATMLERTERMRDTKK